MTLQEYCRLDGGCALIMEPFGEGSAKIRMEEFLPNSDIYARVADELAPYFERMDPPPPNKNEAVARAIFMCGIWASSRLIAARARRPSCLG